MNRSIARHINAALPRNVSIVHPGPAKAAGRCARCGATGVPLKAFEEKFACIDCVRTCRAKYASCAKQLGISCRELTARVRRTASELADGEAVMPWMYATAAEMAVYNAGLLPDRSHELLTARI